MDSEGRILSTIGAFPGNEAYFPPSEHPYTVVSLPLQKISRFAVAGNRLLVGQAEAFEFQVYSTNGHLERIVRRVTLPDPISPQDIETVVNARLERETNEQSRSQLSAMYRSAPYPERMPAYGSLLPDDLGNLWIEAYRFGDLPRTHSDHRLWSVFSSEGVWLGDVRMPQSFGAMQIGDDFVLGVSRDALGIERVEMYFLQKGAN
jgi:hypothetical protein